MSTNLQEGVTTNLVAPPGLRLKLIPLAVVTALGVGIPYLAAYLAFFSSKLLHTPSPRGPTRSVIRSTTCGQLLLRVRQRRKQNSVVL